MGLHRPYLEAEGHGFSQQLEAPGENFQVSVSEALQFSNGRYVQQEFLRDSGDRLVGELKTVTDRPQLIRKAYLNVLSRLPEPEEVQLLDQYLAARSERMVEACQQLLWTLLTNGEFRFNY